MHTTLAAVDIRGFGHPRRDACLQSRLRASMYEQLTEAFTMTGLPWRDCHHEDRGDGALIVAPAEIDADRFLDPLAHHLTATLRRYNKHAGETARLRLRMALHHGYVHGDEHGVTGHATTLLFRLLEAGAAKRAIDAAGSDLGVIVSDPLYTDAAQRGGLFDPDAYRQLRINCKETRTVGWLWLPQVSSPPSG